MISGTEHLKIFVQMPDENIEIKPVPSVFRSFIGLSVRLQRARQKDGFILVVDLVFFNIRDN
jgi:hypothetical protein